MFQRLNRHPKHRWNMLRNMTMSLFTHDRIITTETKAKALLPVVNKIFYYAVRNTKQMHSRIYGLFFNNIALKDKLFNFYVDKYRHNIGGVCRIVKLDKVRLGDNAKMAVVELLYK
jgi:large subunit ribosomal protein L17